MLQQKYSGSLYSISGPSVSPKKRNTPTRHWSAQVHRREEIFSSKNFFFRKRMKHALFLTSTDDAYSNISLLFTQICWHSYLHPEDLTCAPSWDPHLCSILLLRAQEVRGRWEERDERNRPGCLPDFPMGNEDQRNKSYVIQSRVNLAVKSGIWKTLIFRKTIIL